jgi:hypothetical protein
MSKKIRSVIIRLKRGQMNNKMILTVPFSGKEYNFTFQRDMDNRGGWICLDKMKGCPPNIYVPTEMNETLSTLARAKGMTELHNFSTIIPSKKEVKAERTKQEKETRKAEKKLQKALEASSFNPFAMKL